MDMAEITRNLSDTALLERVRAGVEAARNWSEPVFSAMSGWNFENALLEFPDAREFAIAVHELTLRSEKLDHEGREGLLSAIYPLPDQLRPAKAFFARIAPELSRIRELEMFWRNKEAARRRDKEYGVARIAITCFEKDVERIRAFVKKVNEESKFSETVPKKKGGRPRKTLKHADAAVSAAPETTSVAASPTEAAPAPMSSGPPGRQETADERAARERRDAGLKMFGLKNS